MPTRLYWAFGERESVVRMQSPVGGCTDRRKDTSMPTTINSAQDGCPCRHGQSRRALHGGVARPRLTERQREIVLAWLKYGTKERAAQELFVTPSTVKTHIANVMGKLGA